MAWEDELYRRVQARVARIEAGEDPDDVLGPLSSGEYKATALAAQLYDRLDNPVLAYFQIDPALQAACWAAWGCPESADRVREGERPW
jgi:hypothetical protein